MQLELRTSDDRQTTMLLLWSKLGIVEKLLQLDVNYLGTGLSAMKTLVRVRRPCPQTSFGHSGVDFSCSTPNVSSLVLRWPAQVDVRLALIERYDLKTGRLWPASGGRRPNLKEILSRTGQAGEAGASCHLWGCTKPRRLPAKQKGGRQGRSDWLNADEEAPLLG